MHIIQIEFSTHNHVNRWVYELLGNAELTNEEVEKIKKINDIKLFLKNK